MKTELQRTEFSADGLSFAIVVSRWNDGFTSKLAEGAAEGLAERGASKQAVEIFHVPGAFELPLASLKAAESGNFDAVIALAVIIRGDTPHFDYVAGQASSGIMQASMQTGVPVMFGVITADTVEQVIARCGEKADNKGYEAALSAVEMAHTIRKLKGRKEQGGVEEKVFPHVV